MKTTTQAVVLAAMIGVAVVIVAPVLGARQTAQGPVTAAEITRLEQTAGEIERLATALKASDPTLAADASRQLAELSDEVTYLRVKLRREGSVTRAEHDALRDRLETLRLRVGGGKVSAQPKLDETMARIYTVPVATQLDVRLQTPLNSGTAKVEQRFEATTIGDYLMDKNVVIPAGSEVRGFVSSVRPAGRIDRTGSLTLSFDELRIDRRSHRLRASVLQAMDAKTGEDARRIGAGAVVGGIIGGLLGGGKGALLGVIIGGGGAIAATEGSDVDLPVGTILRIRFDQPVEIVR
jgi:hypothetical protein